MAYSSKSKPVSVDTSHIGYAGIWPSNGKDAKVVPIGTPGVPLTDIYDEMMHSNGHKIPNNRPAPTRDHSYPIPVPVPVITPRTRELTRNVIQAGNKSVPGSQTMTNSAALRPKRRSFESLRNSSQPPQVSGLSGPRRTSSKTRLGSDELRSQRMSGNAIPNRRSMGSVSSSTTNTSAARPKKSMNEVNFASSGIPRRSSSVTAAQKNAQSSSDLERHKVPEDYVPRSSFPSCYSSYPSKSSECPVVPHPFSMDNEDGFLNDNFSYPNFQNQDRYQERPRNVENPPPRRSPSRRVTQNAPMSQSSAVRNFMNGKSNIPYNSNITHNRDNYQNYGDSYYNREELQYNPYYKRSTSVDRPTFTNTSSLNPFDSCIPHNHANQYSADTMNCYSVPNKYRNTVHDLTRDDMYADSASCLSPSKTLMYCSGEYGALDADKHIRQNYSSADEVFKPMVYETIVFPPGYFEYKKQLEELRKKYLLDTNPNAFYQMKQNGEFVDYNKTNGCFWRNGKATKKKSHPVFVRTTDTMDHLNRSRPNPACYC
ncbi:hypothetical protein OIY81_1530 [Cryptosporidium canis]|nr:hypothetical protein OIY81_1530 [Cryptosporidium canis]